MSNDFHPSGVLVIEHGRLPSTDYYIKPYVQRFQVPVCYVDSKVAIPDPDLIKPGMLVIFVRYIEGHWAKAVAAVRNTLDGIVFFMDDDLLDPKALQGLPLHYQWKIWKFCLARRKWLSHMNATLWVSTDWLLQKYSLWNPVRIAPVALEVLMQPKRYVRIFYHGTSSHAQELSWLEPVIRHIQNECDYTTFEIFGSAAINRRLADVPRIAVVHPMSWQNYLSHCWATERHIGLAPLLTGRFNAARSHTKFFDIARCRAAGIFSRVEPFSSFVRHGIDGLLVDNNPEAWSATILRLAGDESLRTEIAKAALERTKQCC